MTNFNEKFVPFCLMMGSIVFPVYLWARVGFPEFLWLEVPIVSWWLTHIWMSVESGKEQNV